MSRRGPLAALALVVLLAGCGGSTRNVVSGGEVPGTARTVYSLLPHPGRGTSRDMVLGQKLALEQAGGMAGGYSLSFVSLDDSAPDPAQVGTRAGIITAQAIRDPQIIVVFGGTSSEAARTEIPLIDAAGILHLLPGAGYPGFTRRWKHDDEPARWQPSGNGNSIVRIVPDDVIQGRALVAAALRAAGRHTRPVRIAVEQEPGFAADALRTAIVAAAGNATKIVDSADRADVVIYVGEDPVNAAGVARSVVHTGTPIVLPDAVVMAGIAGRLDPATRRRTVLVSSAPAPDSPAVRRLTPRFEAMFGTKPGPYALLGYRAMNAIISALERVGGRDRRRQAITAAFDPPPSLGFSSYWADGHPLRG
jgi:ABC-type branched-subunit amino acid transport system substrate-binding protein